MHALRLPTQPELLPAEGPWLVRRDGDATGLALYERHYSAYRYADGRRRRLFVGPGHKLVLVTPCARALCVWRRFIDASGQRGVNCAAFRNEGAGLSSTLLRAAMALAWQRWPGERLYTYVDPRRILSRNPGYCFLRAGWRRCGRTKGGLHVLEALPGPLPGADP